MKVISKRVYGTFILDFINSERAQGMAEYALITAMLAAACYGIIRLFGSVLAASFNGLAKRRSGARGVYP